MADLITLKQLHQFDNIELLAKQVVEGFIIGLHKSPFHGFSVEFAEHRIYNPGESIKNIDWKVYARTDKMFVKRYEEETNLRCQIIIDASASMYFSAEGKNKVSKIGFSSLAAASIMYMLKRQRDAVGLSVFSDKVEKHTKASSTTVHHNLLTSYLHKLINEDRRNVSTSATECLHQLSENIHKRSMVVIFSDMFENTGENDELFSALQHLKHNKHEVIMFHVVDKNREIDFNFENRPYLFVDMETGEKVKLQSNQVKEHYVAELKKFKTELKLKCAQYKIDFVEADINKDFSQVLLPYLVKRSKMK